MTEKAIERVEVRAKLKVRRAPYWRGLEPGRYLGFRYMTEGSEGTWIARIWVEGDGKGGTHAYKSLGAFRHSAQKDRYREAKKAAEAWFKEVAKGVTTSSVTVADACDKFVKHLRQEKSEASAKDAEGRFRRLVLGDPLKPIKRDPLADIELGKLQPRHIAEWKARVLASAKDGEAKNPRASFNRNATALRAALNLARQRRDVASDLAWSEELKPFAKDEDGREVNRRRTLYLAPADRRQLIECASAEVRPLLIAMALQPVRPGDIPAAKAEDLDLEHRTLRVSGKTGERQIPLGREAFEHFAAMAKDKLPGAWLICRADGAQWKKEAWRDEVRRAARKARLPRATVAYTLRHSVISDLIRGGLDIFHVAKLAGTSVAMIEKHYGHLAHDHARRALDGLSLKLAK